MKARIGTLLAGAITIAALAAPGHAANWRDWNAHPKGYPNTTAIEKFARAMAGKGIVAVSWYDDGSRSLYNTRHPIKTSADIKGLKLRVG